MMPQILLRRAPDPAFQHTRVIGNDTIDVRFQERGGPQLVKGGALHDRPEREIVPTREESPE